MALSGSVGVSKEARTLGAVNSGLLPVSAAQSYGYYKNRDPNSYVGGKGSSGGSSGSGSGLAGAMNAAADQISKMYKIAQYNNAWSASQAQIQRDWQQQQNAKAMEFNASEAAKNRNWQEMMSNTAHQREVKDLMAAGLNPVLSAMNGNGAAVTSGATAQGVTSAGAKGDTDTSLNGAIVNLLGSLLSAQTQLQASTISARAQQSVADTYTAMERIVAGINQATTLGAAGISAEASKYSANQHYAASKYSSDMQKYLAANYPSSMYGFLSALASSITGNGGITGAVDVGKSLINSLLGEEKYTVGASGRASGGFSNNSVSKILKGLLK